MILACQDCLSRTKYIHINYLAKGWHKNHLGYISKYWFWCCDPDFIYIELV